jgi:hypothetical protein
MEWRFAQVSDAQLGAKVSRLDPDVASALREGSREAVSACFRIAREQQCEAVLIPGDLYMLRGVDPPSQLRFVYERAADYPALRFFIAPGNADAYGGNCPYAYVAPPSNVRVFTEAEWQTVELEHVTITGRAFRVGEGVPALDWSTVPPPDPAKLTVLLARGTLAGTDDGRSARRPDALIEVEPLLACGYSYVALGGMHARIELRREGERAAAAAYASTPQCLGFDARGPGGFLTGTLRSGGAELAFHRTARYEWKTHRLSLPLPYVEQYAAKLDTVLESLPRDHRRTDLLRLAFAGEAHENLKQELDRRLAAMHDAVLLLEVDAGDLAYFSGPNPAALPADSLLGKYLQRCAAEAAQAGADPQVYELARRLGWLLFTGRGLPAEIQQ